MNIEEFREYCLSLPGTAEKMPFEKFFRGKHSFLAFYVNGKIFCYFDIDAFDRCTIKCPSSDIAVLEERYNAVESPYNGNKKHWISVRFNDDMPDSQIKRLVAKSYDIVCEER